MKKSVIFLGASACILAIAGAFTTKGSTKVVLFTGWTNGSNGCNKYTTECTDNGFNTCFTSQNGIKTVFTKNDCENKLLTAGA